MSQNVLLAALIANFLTPIPQMITVDKGFIAPFNQQAVIDRIRSYNNGKFSCVSVDASIMLINYQTFTKPLQILYKFYACKS